MVIPRFTSRAHADLVEIGEYIGRSSLVTAARIADRIEAECALITANPDRGSWHEDLPEDLLVCAVASYLIVYRIDEAGALILRVVHGARDLGQLFSRELIRPMFKFLDRKLAAIHADPSGAKDFILADAKDADMAFGIGAPGLSPERHEGELRHKTLAEYREQIRQVIRQGIVDIVLMSTSTSDQLTLEEGLFDDSTVTPAARANDATDVHLPRGGKVHTAAARPFRTAAIDHMQCGHLDCDNDERPRGANLGLYSVTYNNDLERDLETLTRYKEFREEAERKGFRHFLEVFDPNLSGVVPPELLGGFINDLIARTLAGVAQAGRPVFLKIVYHGPKAMEELVRYDPHLVVGVLGGAAGTTYDAFKLLGEAKKYGARAALFGRKINQAENQLAFIELLRLIADDVLTPEEAVRAYHGVLAKLGVTPHRTLEDDLQLRTAVMSYGGSGSQVSVPVDVTAGDGKRKAESGSPNFATMSPVERLAYHRERLKKTFGG